ncbi:MAG TPA: response regulator [Ktedonobacteraceae bacterium]|nr:response regulator [Ktedonobacteraceae bacterium]
MNELQQSPVEQKAAMENQLATKAVLVVEDDINIGMFLVMAIEEEAQHHVLLATDGVEALRFVQSIKPQLFILDQQLPSMSGLELYDHLLSVDGVKETPVLFVSANPPVQEFRKRNLQYLKKPFDLDDLLQTVDLLLED